MLLHWQKKRNCIQSGNVLSNLTLLGMVESVCGREQKKGLEKISLANHTVRCHINAMSRYILDHVADESEANKARASLQLDESNEVSNCTYLLAYCRYVHAGKLEEFLMCESVGKWLNVPEKSYNKNDNISFNRSSAVSGGLALESNVTAVINCEKLITSRA